MCDHLPSSPGRVLIPSSPGGWCREVASVSPMRKRNFTKEQSLKGWFSAAMHVRWSPHVECLGVTFLSLDPWAGCCGVGTGRLNAWSWLGVGSLTFTRDWHRACCHFRKESDPHKLSQELEDLRLELSVCESTLGGNLAKMLKGQSCPNTTWKAHSGDVSSAVRGLLQMSSWVNSHNGKGLGDILNSQAHSWGWVKLFHLKLPLCEKCKFGDK